jgi:hypothetical protein
MAVILLELVVLLLVVEVVPDKLVTTVSLTAVTQA